MPEIYVCFQNLAYGFKCFAREDFSFKKTFSDFELKLAINMEENRAKLFGNA